MLGMLRVGVVICVIGVPVIGLMVIGCSNRKIDKEPSLKVQRIEKELNGGTHVVFDGYYKDGQSVEHGQCVVVFKNGLRCEMLYSHGVANGECKWYYKDGAFAFQGTYKMGKPWNGIVMPLGISVGLPHKYSSGKDNGPWTDPKGVFVDE